MIDRLQIQISGVQRPLSFDPEGRGAPLLTSANTPWAGMPFELHEVKPFARAGGAGPVDGECGVVVLLDGAVDLAVRRDRREVRGRLEAGSMFFVSGDSRPDWVRMNGNARAVAVRFPQAWFERYSVDGPPKGFGRTPPLHRDETVRTLARLMCEEVERGGANGRLYSESLSMALFSYVLERVPAAPARASGALNDGQRRSLQQYVASRLHEELSLSDLSARVGLGPRHFSKLFQRAFGTTPHQYVLQARLAEGARLLSDGKHDIAAIAFHVGFSSQSHFTAAFRRAYGVTPRRYASERRPTQIVR